MINGIAFCAIFITGISVKDDATNKLTPIGGVTKPIARFTTIMTPKWIGSIPIAVTIGSKIGVKIRIAGVVSITIPTISKNTLITSKITILLWKLLKIHALIVCGTRINVNTLENAIDAAKINRIGAYVLTPSTMIPQISLNFMDL